MIGIRELRHLNARREHVRRVEPAIRADEGDEAAPEKRRPDQQHTGDGNLPRHDHRANTRGCGGAARTD